MESISLKLEDTFLKEIEESMKKHRYTTKTEFIREAIRDKIITLEKQGYMMHALSLYGAGKKKHGNITDEQIHKAREQAFKELAKELGAE